MNQINEISSTIAGRDQHLEALDQLLTQLRAHLTASAEKKRTYGDYLRLLEFYREARGAHAADIIVGWVDNETFATDLPV